MYGIRMGMPQEAQQSPFEASTPPGMTPARRAGAILDAVLHGMSLEEIAAKCAGGSIVRILQMLAEGVTEAEFLSIIQLHEKCCGLAVERLKTEAVLTLASIMTGDAFAQTDGPLTSDDVRRIELRRRACTSILRLNPLPTRRDSAADARIATLRSDDDASPHPPQCQSDSPAAPRPGAFTSLNIDDRAPAVRNGKTQHKVPPDVVTSPRLSQNSVASEAIHQHNGHSPYPTAESGDQAAPPPATTRESATDATPRPNRAARRRLLRLQRKSLARSSAGSTAEVDTHPP